MEENLVEIGLMWRFRVEIAQLVEMQEKCMTGCAVEEWKKNISHSCNIDYKESKLELTKLNQA